MNSSPSKTLIVLAFVAIYFVWGTTYLAALWGLEGMKPFVLSTLRYSLAGIILSVWCLVKQYRLPDWTTIRISSSAGIIMLVGGSGLVVVAEQYISSGHAAVVIATEPLWFLLLDRKRWRQYLSNWMVIAGLLIGFIGIGLFSYFTPEQQMVDNSRIVGTLLTLAGSVLWVVGALYYERSPETKSHPHIMMTAIQLLGAAAFSAILALLLGEWKAFDIQSMSSKAWGGLCFLVVMGSIVAYMAFMWLMKVQPPAIVSTHTYVNPVVAVIAGWILAGEKITGMQSIALAIVLIGVLLTRGKTKLLH